MTIIVVSGSNGVQTLKTHCESKQRAREVWDEYIQKGYTPSYYEYTKRS